jgi:hypothetical protein
MGIILKGVFSITKLHWQLSTITAVDQGTGCRTESAIIRNPIFVYLSFQAI